MVKMKMYNGEYKEVNTEYLIQTIIELVEKIVEVSENEIAQYICDRYLRGVSREEVQAIIDTRELPKLKGKPKEKEIASEFRLMYMLRNEPKYSKKRHLQKYAQRIKNPDEFLQLSDSKKIISIIAPYMLDTIY